VVFHCATLCKNDSLQCCNKLTGNKLDFATGNWSDVQTVRPEHMEIG